MKDNHHERFDEDNGPPPMSIEELLHLMRTSGRPVIAEAEDHSGPDDDWRRDMGDNWGGWRSDGGWGE